MNTFGDCWSFISALVTPSPQSNKDREALSVGPSWWQVKGVFVIWQPAGEIWPCPRVFSSSQWREWLLSIALNVTSRTFQSTVWPTEKFVKTAQLLVSSQSPRANASSKGYYRGRSKSVSPGRSTRSPACHAKSSPRTRRFVDPSVFVVKSNMWRKTDRPQSGVRMLVQHVVFLAEH